MIKAVLAVVGVAALTGIACLVFWQVVTARIRIDCPELGKDPTILFQGVRFPEWDAPVIFFGAVPDPALRLISTDVGVFEVFRWRALIVASG